MDKTVRQIIEMEHIFQDSTLQMIASENYQSTEVLRAVGSVFGNRYAEGYPGKRYYGGQVHTDAIEQLAISRAKKLFGFEYANVQPHSGSQANAAVYSALLEQGDKVLAMDLTHGGHLTHGSKVNFSGKTYEFYHYGVDNKGYLDYDEIEKIAKKVKPKMIVAGASAYTREINFTTFSSIANSVGAILMVDMAHIAGLVATGHHMSPLGWADVVTSTTHKTLRGARGGLILTSDESIIKKVNSAIFPGTQGGPLMNNIAGKAVAFEEAMTDDFKRYISHLLENTRSLASSLTMLGYDLVSGGTDNHMILIDLTNKGVTGAQAQKALEKVGIICNKNTVPGEKLSPFETSGIRLGMAALTTRDISPWFPSYIGQLIDETIRNIDNEEELINISFKVREVASTLKNIYYKIL